MSEVSLYHSVDYECFVTPRIRVVCDQNCSRNDLKVKFISGRGTTRAEDAQGTPTESFVTKYSSIRRKLNFKKGCSPPCGLRWCRVPKIVFLKKAIRAHSEGCCPCPGIEAREARGDPTLPYSC